MKKLLGSSTLDQWNKLNNGGLEEQKNTEDNT